MDKIIQNTKIFFNMSSIDKSLLVDYFRENTNNTVCTIGQCDSDIDSILSSDIGISLKNPKNLNTILCHYYSTKNDIICIKDIIINGKIFFEDNVLLESISFVCSFLLNGYLLCCILRNVHIKQDHINFLEIEFFILTVFSFFGKIKENIKLIQNSKILNRYYYFQLGENLIFKMLSVFIFCVIYEGDFQIDYNLLNIEFQNYAFALVIEFLICGILSINFISFYRESIISNFYLIIVIVIYLFYLITLILLTSSNYNLDLLSITNFMKTENLMDAFTDKNRLYLLISLLFDFFGTLLTNWLTLIIFNIFMK